MAQRPHRQGLHGRALGHSVLLRSETPPKWFQECAAGDPSGVEGHMVPRERARGGVPLPRTMSRVFAEAPPTLRPPCGGCGWPTPRQKTLAFTTTTGTDTRRQPAEDRHLGKGTHGADWARL